MQISHSNAMLMMVCHERTSDHTGMRCCTRDEGRSLETGLQEQVSNHRKLRWSRARVVSVTEKAGYDSVRYGSKRRAKANHR